MSSQQQFSPFQPHIPEGRDQRHYWGRLYGSSKALAITRAAEATEQPVVVVTSDMLAASRLYDEIHFFLDPEAAIDVLTFPDWETLPYDQYSPYQDIISGRLATLVRLTTSERVIMVVPVTTVMHRVIPRDYLLTHSLMLETGQTLSLEEFRRRLRDSGYNITPQVMEHGEAAIRGSLLDIFPMGSDNPYRIDLLDDEIDSIREFDPETQRSIGQVQNVRILPAREVALTDEGIACFRSAWRARFEGNPNDCPVYRDVSQGLAPSGIEYYLPLFFRETCSLFDYLPDRSLLVLDEAIEDAVDAFWQETRERYESHRHDIERPVLKPQEIFFEPTGFYTRIKPFAKILARHMEQPAGNGVYNYATTTPVRFSIDARARDPLALLQRFLDSFNGRVLIAAETLGRRETLLELFHKHGLRPAAVDNWSAFVDSDIAFGLTVATLEQGAQIDDPGIAVISESQLFGERVMQRRLRKRKQQDTEAIVRNLTELSIGAPVVHEDHGVGRYQGLVKLEAGGIPAEYIMLEYDGGDKLYVPVASLELISRYTGVDPDHAPLHRLGSGQWEKARRKAAQRVFDVAAELLDIQARRAARQGFSFHFESTAYHSFVQGFPFEETPDQADAIEAVINDMKDPKPMDRLVCGDAGFGKTEVALRAAFIAVENGKQVALLVPTTLLAQQHFQNFRDRFADHPVRVELISRFRSGKEQAAVVAGLKDGSIDIIIGTHKLIQGNMQYKQLGLVIIDEEHRFGVRQKERFKALRTEVDVLTLTATPIPRTLNMALSNIRELSIISTPPSRRLAVKTFVREWNEALLKEAITREIKRGGQVFFLHNRVESIVQTADKIRKLMPGVRVEIAHGQMPEKELERVMLDFYHRRFSILVCTTIIETGIDVPSANTMIIDRADKFGLAQLYQLRGRVGRSHHRAYAYLIVPPRKAMTADAIKRLEAIESLEDLGIGFTLATHDLEIRGSGEILGDEQSGHIQAIGFGLYMDMLDRAVRALKSGKQPSLDRPFDQVTDINLHVPALIPDDYLPDVHTRLILYKRMAGAESPAALEDLKAEMIDRFGLLPEAVQNLFRITAVKIRAHPIGIKKIDLGESGGRLVFAEEANVNPERIIHLLRTHPADYRLDGQDKLRVMRKLPDPEQRFEVLEELLDHIGLDDAA
jgi:transcription-repair coupling factor (superfamily II helicase)